MMPSPPSLPLQVLNWGCLSYEQARQRQQALIDQRIADAIPDTLVLLEHPPVITLGRSATMADLKVSRRFLADAGIRIHQSERGGQMTYHAPGQLVVWPVIRLAPKGLHDYVERLLAAAGDVLEAYGLEAQRQPGRPGLWVRGAKIASIGIAVRRWVTGHGLALNVSLDLTGFEYIAPCGQPEEKVTSLTELLKPAPSVDMQTVQKHFIRAFRHRFNYEPETEASSISGRHPPWLVRPAPQSKDIARMEERLRQWRLNTVCQGAHCPNLGECFGRGTATFMILGPHCTRRCRFCAVTHQAPLPPDADEPQRVARAARSLQLRHVVVTSVTRDDLPDGGAGHFVAVIKALRHICPEACVEVLTPDFEGSLAALQQVLAARPDVFNHNLETVPRLYPLVRPEASWSRSLAILQQAATAGMAVKSGLMLGLGETAGELREALQSLRRHGCQYLTLGQYLAPSSAHAPVARYVPPEEFTDWAAKARRMGFRHVAAGPLVRSSYRAESFWES